MKTLSKPVPLLLDPMSMFWVNPEWFQSLLQVGYRMISLVLRNKATKIKNLLFHRLSHLLVMQRANIPEIFCHIFNSESSSTSEDVTLLDESLNELLRDRGEVLLGYGYSFELFACKTMIITEIVSQMHEIRMKDGSYLPVRVL